jgi:signal peptidase I
MSPFDLLRVALLTLILVLSEGANGQTYTVESHSMQPTFYKGDSITVTPIGDTPLKRGELVVFQHPFNPEESHFKRIIGLPSETLTITGAEIWIDGKKINEPYGIVPMPEGYQYETVLKAGEYFVLGDNRPNSSDSRRFGPIQIEMIIGRVKVTAWNRLFSGRD